MVDSSTPIKPKTKNNYMKYVTVLVPVSENQVLSMMKAHDITVAAALTKIVPQNMKIGFGTIDAASLMEVTYAIEADNNKPEEVTKLNLQQFINTYKPLSANKYPLEEEITREDKILFYYTVGTKRESTALLDQPNSKTESYLWVITAEHIDNEVVVTVRPYVAGNITLTKYQDLQGYVVTTKPHNDKNVIITISI